MGLSNYLTVDGPTYTNCDRRRPIFWVPAVHIGVINSVGPHKATNRLPGESLETDTRILEALINHFQELPLLRVHGNRIHSWNTKELSVEILWVYVLEEHTAGGSHRFWFPGAVMVRFQVET